MYILLCGHVQPRSGASELSRMRLVSSGFIFRCIYGAHFRSAVLAIYAAELYHSLISCVWLVTLWAHTYLLSGVYPFVDKWMSVHVSYVLGCCHGAGAEHHHTNSGPNYFLL